MIQAHAEPETWLQSQTPRQPRILPWTPSGELEEGILVLLSEIWGRVWAARSYRVTYHSILLHTCLWYTNQALVSPFPSSLVGLEKLYPPRCVRGEGSASLILQPSRVTWKFPEIPTELIHSTYIYWVTARCPEEGWWLHFHGSHTGPGV